MGFFKVIDRLKQLVGINNEIVEMKAEELEQEGYNITNIDENEIEIEIPTGETEDEVLQKVFEEDTYQPPPPEPYTSYFYEFRTRDDKNVCPYCETEAELAGELELQLDPTGSVHEGADEKKIQDYTDYKYYDLLNNPMKSVTLEHTVSPHRGKGICRCRLQFTHKVSN